MTGRPLTGVVEDLLRELAPQTLGAVMRRAGDFDVADDALQEALVDAADQWPVTGVPVNPRGWLFRVANRRSASVVLTVCEKRGLCISHAGACGTPRFPAIRAACVVPDVQRGLQQQDGPYTRNRPTPAPAGTSDTASAAASDTTLPPSPAITKVVCA